MGYILFLVFLLLLFSTIFSLVRKGSAGMLAKFFRIATVVFTIFIFTYWFFKSSVDRMVENDLSIQIVNKLPQKLDFYLIKIQNSKDKNFITKHLGNIRPEYYRIEHLKMNNSDEYWVTGYLGKNPVYFTQHSVPNKNIDQIVEAKNYIIQNEKFSKVADKQINSYNSDIKNLGIWATLDFLLLFINLALLIRNKK